MIDISLPQLIIIGAVGYVSLGAGDLSMAARMAGYGLGRAVVRVRNTRDVLTNTFTANAKSNIQPELKQGFSEFMQVQNDLRAATMNPIHSMHHLVMNQRADPSANGHPGDQQSQQPLQQPFSPSNAASGPAGQSWQTASGPRSAPGSFVSSDSPSSSGRAFVPSAKRAALYRQAASQAPSDAETPLPPADPYLERVRSHTDAIPGGADVLLQNLGFRRRAIIEAHMELQREAAQAQSPPSSRTSSSS
mmetsp:Transcript_4177/g.7970  ORF Transcript_4177/g.7970 Transcript_4177/m.7970 type:complete len:248 (-) Transcript_4177:172-915(-)